VCLYVPIVENRAPLLFQMLAFYRNIAPSMKETRKMLRGTKVYCKTRMSCQHSMKFNLSAHSPFGGFLFWKKSLKTA